MTKLKKYERMEIRKAIGNRLIARREMSPYVRGPAYLIAHACFDCRKSWKLLGDIEHCCPECSRTLAIMGRSFRVPKKREREQWEKLRKLWTAGFRFWSYRSFPLAEPYPDKLNEVDAWIERNLKHPMRIAI